MPGLLATKLHKPSTPTKYVHRPQLSQRLDEGLALKRQITLVSAPAGFGKTTCVCEWLVALGNYPVAWLSLEPADDDPGRFFSYFVAALQKVAPSLGLEIEGVIRSGQLPPAEMISAALIEDISEFEGRLLLVLDDFHLIQDSFILQVFEQLLANFPPPLHLVLISREDPPLPLARLRANNLLTEIRARDLRFSRQDVDCFLNQVMGISLPQADIAALEDKTEGWVAGLQLAGLSVKDIPNPSGFIARLSGSHRFILSYLTEQVLGQQTEEVQQFLVQTAILDKLNGDLCEAVTERSDSHALLERLFKANLFLIPLDDEGQWYRYHHLFADLLRNLQHKLPKEKTAALHRSASQWYAQAGLVSEAIRHALAGADYEAAVALLESHAMELILQGYVKTVDGWARAIPVELALQSPRTDLAFTWMHILGGDYAQANSYLERLRTNLEATPGSLPEDEREALKAEWLALQALMLYRDDKAQESKAMATQALEITPQQDSRLRSLGYYALASACALMEDYPGAVEAYRLSIQHGQAGVNPMTETMSTVGLAGMALEHGQLHLAFEIASQAVERIERSGALPPISAVVYAALGDVKTEWFQLEVARRHLLRALHLSALGGANTATIFCHALLSRLCQLEGDMEEAALEIQKAAELIPLEAPEYIQQEIVAQQVNIELARRRPYLAEMALQGLGFAFQGGFTYPALPDGEGIAYSLGLLYASSLRFLLYQVQSGKDASRLKPGMALADDLIDRASNSQRLSIALEALLLRAQMHTALRNNQASQADYVNALELAEPEGFIGLFVEQGQPVAKALEDLAKRGRLGKVEAGYVEGILEAFRRQPTVVSTIENAPAALIEPLTGRELEVLRLMAEGLKYKEIAAQLFISQNTVRFHVKAIYGKLNASNRTQAIALARQIQIL